MAGFDPQAYAAKHAPKADDAPPAFDPAAYAAKHAPKEEKGRGIVETVRSMRDAGMRGVAQGGFSGFADEATGVAGAATGAGYSPSRDYARKGDDKAFDEHPLMYGGGVAAGTVLSMFAPGIKALGAAKTATEVGTVAAKALGPVGSAMVRRMGNEGLGRAAIASGQGAMSAVGGGDSDLTKGDLAGVAKEAAIGGTLGGVLQTGATIAAEPAKRALGWLGKKAGVTLGGVAEKNIDAYLANPKAIKNAPTLEGIKDQVDASVAGPLIRAEQARLGERQAKDALGEAWQLKLEDLRSKAVPVEQAREIGQRLESELAALAGMSKEADAALDSVAATFRKADLVKFIDEVGRSVGVGPSKAVVGDASTAAVKRLHELRERVVGALPDDLSAADIRGVMRDIRKDIDFDRAAGATNDTLTGLRKKVTGGMSDMLKRESPEYANIMGKMAPRSQAVELMSEHFGTPDKALAALETLASGKGPRATYLRDVVDKYVKATGQTDVLDELKDIAEARRILQTPSARGAVRASLPEAQQLGKTQASLSGALEEAETYKGWSPGSTENRLKSVMAGRSIENRKTIESLSQATGLDFSEMLKNRAVADAFEKGYMHGSRNVNLWSIIGTVFGGKALGGGEKEPLARFAGALFGGSIDRFGPKVTQRAIDAFMAVRDSKYLPLLEGAAAKGKDSLARTHMVLMSNPDYRAMFGGDDKSSETHRRLQGAQK